MSERWKVVVVDDRLPRRLHGFRICIIRYNLCDLPTEPAQNAEACDIVFSPYF
jgi:hypothetical protein